MGIAAVIRNLGARRQGSEYRCACPRDCSYDVTLRSGKDGTPLWNCKGGCSQDQVELALVPYGLLDDDGAGDWDIIEPKVVEPSVRIAAACRIYDSFAPAAGTPIELARYLRARSITVAVPLILRFGMAPHRCGGRFPAMVAPIVDVTGEQTGIHMTYLRPDGGGKADLPRDLQRETRGVVRSGAIRLTEHDPDRELAVAEGIESALAAMQIFGLPGWSAVYAGNLPALELPLAIRRILITADNDVSGAGQRNALAAYRRWTSEGRSVQIALPPDLGDDFNDVLAKRA
jgi:hypothetical protein